MKNDQDGVVTEEGETLTSRFPLTFGPEGPMTYVVGPFSLTGPPHPGAPPVDTVDGDPGLSPIHDPQMTAPRSNGVGVLLGHRSGNLSKVGQVVSGPRCKQLSHGYNTDIRMYSGSLHIISRKVHPSHRVQVVSSE